MELVIHGAILIDYLKLSLYNLNLIQEVIIVSDSKHKTLIFNKLTSYGLL